MTKHNYPQDLMKTVRSAKTIQFADVVKNRLLGNDEEHKLLEMDEYPRRKFVTGVIYTEHKQKEAFKHQKDYQYKVTPNSYSVEFNVDADRFDVEVLPSFWLWFKTKPNSKLRELCLKIADSFTEDVLWTPWDQRIQSYQNLLDELQNVMQGETNVADDLNEEDEEEIPKKKAKWYFIRKRYCKQIAFNNIEASNRNEDNPYSTRQELDLLAFGDAHQHLGLYPHFEGKAGKWEGEVRLEAWKEGSVLTRVKITIVNTSNAQWYEPCWFDARARIKVTSSIKPTYCPELKDEVKSITSNCILDFARNQSNDRHTNVFYVEQIGTVVLDRRVPIDSVAFKDFAQNPVVSCEKVIEQLKALGVSEGMINMVADSVKILKNDATAENAASLVSQVFDMAFRHSNRHDAVWRLFQIVTLLCGIVAWVRKKETKPLVLNVPTAGGKTEAFVSCMLFAAFYERLNGRKAVNIVKYPYRMLSRQQKTRIATYMVFAEQLAEKIGKSPLILGYFAGRSSKGSVQKEYRDIVPNCPLPLCQADWKEEEPIFESNEAAKLICKNGHILYVSSGDMVFASTPSIIIATLDKFVAKCYQSEMGNILGAPNYYCSTHGYTVFPKCKKCKNNLSSGEPVKVAFWTLDESHLIREEDGTMDSHYEKAHTDIAEFNTGVRPIPIISTATISGIERFVTHLGFGDYTIMIPSNEDKEKFMRNVTDENWIHHVVIAIEPRDRAVVFALARLVEEWANAMENSAEKELSHLKQMMIYFPSYDKLYQTQDALENDINKNRLFNKKEQLRMEEATGRLSESEIEQWFDKVEKGEIDLTLATKLASIGIDVQNLNCIAFYGVPTQISEFVQVINRTARTLPGVAFIVLDPNKERDRSYYDYMNLFVTKAHSKLVEEIPINRFARSAINYTFANVAFSTLLFHYGPTNKADYREAKNVMNDIPLIEKKVIHALHQIFMTDKDDTEAYEKILTELWDTFRASLSQAGVKYIWDKYWGTKYLPNTLKIFSEDKVTVTTDETVSNATFARLMATRTRTGEDVEEDTGEEME